MTIFAANMEKAGAILLIALYGLGLVRPAMPLVEYYLKMEEYKAKCINRAKPKLHCDGKCYLMKQLKAFHTEKSLPTSPAPVKINFEDYPVALIAQRTLYLTSIDNRKKLYPPQHDTAISSYTVEIFHPPKVS